MSQAKFEDSNIANIGSKEDHALRELAAHKEQAWTNAGEKEGLQIWRVEKFKIVAWPLEKYGSFYSGDAYLVLKTYKPDPKSEKLAWNIHFWLGTSSSQDEQGTAAYKTVELDDFLHDTPVEYREVQGFESDTFRSLFPHITYLEGGVDSGFTHVTAAQYKPRLLRLAGVRHHMALTQVPISLDSLDDAYSYVLDDGLRIFQWNGTKANPAEKRKADQIIHSLVEERDGKPKHIVLDGLEANNDFWTFFGGKPPSIPSGKIVTPLQTATETLLWKLIDNAGQLSLQKVANGAKVPKNALTTETVYFVDNGLHLFVYVGKKATTAEKKNAITVATGYLKAEGKGRELTTAISRVIEGTQSKEFELLLH